MGMYTDFSCRFNLKNTTSNKVFIILKEMISIDTEEIETYGLEHPLFKTERWTWFLNFDGDSYLTYDKQADCWEVNIQCSFKNYDNEIEHFLNWIKQYIKVDLRAHILKKEFYLGRMSIEDSYTYDIYLENGEIVFKK